MVDNVNKIDVAKAYLNSHFKVRFGNDSSGLKDISSIKSKTKSELSYDVFNKFMANADQPNNCVDYSPYNE